MRDVDRREFITKVGKWVLLGSAFSFSGCGRLLDWSDRKKQATRKEMKKVPSALEPVTYPDLAVVKGEDPEQNVRKAMGKLGGMGRFVKKGARVVVKPNLLTAREPQYAVTTNPLVIGALIKMCHEAGASEVVVLDGPTSAPEPAYELSGIAEATQKAGGVIKILTDRNYENTLIPEGQLLRQWPLVKDIFEADVFINVPIAKTHGLSILTMAMKNLMGIMGSGRVMMHIDFDQKIVDLNTLVRPHLVVLDAYRILVRNGPTGGDLSDVEMKKSVVVGTNQVSVDAYGTSFFGMKPTDLPYLVKAKEQNVGEIDLNKLNIAEEIV